MIGAFCFYFLEFIIFQRVLFRLFSIYEVFYVKI